LNDPNFFSPEFFYAHLGIIVIFGFLFGSFLNVCIYRIPAGLSIVLPGSHCYSCGTPISWYDNIPLLSYLILRGRCRYCNSSFSIRYFLIELMTGLFFGLTFYYFRYTLASLVYIVFICLLIVATFTDFDHWIIPDGVSLYGALFGLAAAALAGFYPRGFIVSNIWPLYGAAAWKPFLNALSGAAAGALLLYAIGAIGTFAFQKEAMGFGDVKLFLLIGSMLGVINCIYVLMIASFIGSIVGIPMFILAKISDRKKKSASPDALPECSQENPREEPDREEIIIQRLLSASKGKGGNAAASPGLHHIPFGPYIALAAIIVLFWGEKIHNYLFGIY